MLTRRQFALGGAAMVSASALDRSRASGAPVSHDMPLPIPVLIDSERQGRAVQLRVAPGRHAFLKSKPTTTYGYSSPVLGPVIRVRRGEELEITVENALDCDTTLHWHGLRMPGDLDGGPHQIIKPSRSWRPVLKIDQPASTAWFHPHPHHDTARQLYMGLAGMMIIEDGSEARL